MTAWYSSGFLWSSRSGVTLARSIHEASILALMLDETAVALQHLHLAHHMNCGSIALLNLVHLPATVCVLIWLVEVSSHNNL